MSPNQNRERLVFVYACPGLSYEVPGFYIPKDAGEEELRRLFFELKISGVTHIVGVGFEDAPKFRNFTKEMGLTPLFCELPEKSKNHHISEWDENGSAQVWGELINLLSLSSADELKAQIRDRKSRLSWFVPLKPTVPARLWIQKIKNLNLPDSRDFVLEAVGYRSVNSYCIRSMRRAVDAIDRNTSDFKFSLIMAFSDFDGRWKKSLIEFLEKHENESCEIICVFNTDAPVSPAIRSEAFEFFRTEKTEKKRFAGISFQWIEARFASGIFRAGLSRNLGAHFARSEFLLFMDADMQLAESYRPWEWPERVSVTRRWDVTENPVRRLKMEKYWEDFNWRGEQLLKEPKGWKYLCSHSLALSKTLFDKLGAFSWIYQTYGHEDTEFAYRLWRENTLVQLHGEASLHFRATQESNPVERQESLQETGFQFLQTHPVLEVAEFSEYLWSLSFRIGKKLKKSKRLAGSLLWKSYGAQTQKPMLAESQKIQADHKMDSVTHG